MKLSAKTIQYLKNFASINQSIIFREGSTLSTISNAKTIMGQVSIDSEIDKEFAIYDLSKFLGTLSLFQDPEIELKDTYAVISEAGKGSSKKVNYTFTEPSLITAPPKLLPKMPSDFSTTFTLTQELLSDILKAQSVLGVPDIAVTGDGTTLSIRAVDSKNPSADEYAQELTSTNLTFNAVFKAENIKIIPGTYEVEIGYSSSPQNKIAVSKFSGEASYFITLESNSQFNA